MDTLLYIAYVVCNISASQVGNINKFAAYFRLGSQKMNLWAEVSFLLFVLLYLQKKLFNSSAISLIFEFDFPFMINVSGMVG